MYQLFTHVRFDKETALINFKYIQCIYGRGNCKDSAFTFRSW